MKTSTRIRFAAVLAALVVVAFCFSACPHKEDVANQDRDDWTFKLMIKKTSHQEWAAVKKQDFDDALCDLDKSVPNNPNGKKGEYLIRFKATANPSETPHENYHPTCPSGAAEKSAVGASAANDPNATQHIRVQRAQDLEAVLAAFVEPSPTPTPVH
jgi:hypothetical protein